MSNSEGFSGPGPNLPQTENGASEAGKEPPKGKDWKAHFAPNPDGKRALKRRLKRPKRKGLQALSMAARAAMAGQLDLAAGHLDHRTGVARALREYRLALIARRDRRGGLTPEAETVIDIAVTDRLIMSSLDAVVQELGAAGELIDRDKMAIIPLLRDRAYLAADMTKRLQALGLDADDELPGGALNDHIVANYTRRKRATEE